VLDTLASIQFYQSSFDLRQEDQTLDSVFERGIRRELFDRFENLLFGGDACH